MCILQYVYLNVYFSRCIAHLFFMMSGTSSCKQGVVKRYGFCVYREGPESKVCVGIIIPF